MNHQRLHVDWRIVLLLLAAFIGVQRSRQIRESAAHLAQEQFTTTRLIDEVQREQGTLEGIFQVLAHRGSSIDKQDTLRQLEQWEQRIDRIVESAQGTPEAPLWADLQRACHQSADEARRWMEAPDAGRFSAGELFSYDDQVIATTARLIDASYGKAAASQAEIRRISEQLRANSLVLLGACLLMAALCAAVTMRMVTGLFRQMEWQAGELSRVSWQLLESQEATARRFSHELHDELGQALTAVKANLSALRKAPDANLARVADCERLVDDSIHNVRELSQLLRPTILDDFGLDASLRWLCEGFTQRTGIAVEYQSDFDGRLADETETHLFRIAQEALTNVARHSGASNVQLALRASNGNLRLSISDNGRGIDLGAATLSSGLGMVGMRARARNAGGELTLASQQNKGFRIDVKVPARRLTHEQENQNSAGR